MKLVTTEDVTQEGTLLRMIVYGEPGTGKTWFGASGGLDDLTAPCLFVEYRAQIATLRSEPKFLQAIDEGKLIIVRLDQYSDLNQIHHWLKNGRGSYKTMDTLMEQLGHADDLMPKTVVIDSLTELQRSEVMRRAGNQEGKFLVDVESPQIRDWGALLNQFTLLAHLFFQLPYHVIFGGLERVDYGESPIGEAPPIQGYRLALQGQAQRQFPAYALLLMRLDRAARNLKAYNVGYTQAIKAKTKQQYGNIPAKIPNPTIPKLVKLLTKEV